MTRRGLSVFQRFLYARVTQQRFPDTLPDGVLDRWIVRVFGRD